MAQRSPHNEWYNLVERSGPFLAISVLDEVFPQGLDTVMLTDRNHILGAYDEWQTAVDEQDPDLSDLHNAWINELFETLLHYDARILKAGNDLPDTLSFTSLEHGATIQPDCAIVAQNAPRLLINVYPPGTSLEAKIAGENWQASPAERMTQLCRATQVRIGLVTNGERWMLVDSPEGGVTGYTSWYARLWRQEPTTLQAFYSLFSAERFFRTQEETLEGMLEQSLQFQEQVTDTLGQQVRRAVEVLTQALDRADTDRNRELLAEVADAELYEASLTVMMRLVFLLCAEERELLLLGDPLYDANYAVSTLRSRLLEEEDKHGSQVLESGYDAWPRLLALFRGVYGGIEHEALRLPALGGSLFDPDRYPFLEGRAHNTHWRDGQVQPLAIDNRTVLLLLNALQVLEQTAGAQLLTYRALDVEQIGHVYEGLLEHTVHRVPDITLGLVGSAKAKSPNILLAELESANADGQDELLEFLKDTTARSPSALSRAMAAEVDEQMLSRLQQASGSAELAQRIKPFAALLRQDNWGEPLVYRKNAFCITEGSDRRETGTHYTPKTLTETVVTETLEPVVYVGPAEGVEREKWQLKTAAELLDLKICDMAMGSGAFLVQVIRYLGDRVIEAWQLAEATGKAITVDGEVVDELNRQEATSERVDERVLTARRLIAERCVYGVDMNPLAVELAKLSIWLVTLAKGRPFGFLDHNLRSGDSLLGIQCLDQLYYLNMHPGVGAEKALFAQNIEDAIAKAAELRDKLRRRIIRDIRDVENMAELDFQSRRILELPELIADALLGEVLCAGGEHHDLMELSIQAGEILHDDKKSIDAMIAKTKNGLSIDLPAGKPARNPFHWPIEFPEIFSTQNSGFDAILGNPPYVGGRKISGAMGKAYQQYLIECLVPDAEGSADYIAFFFMAAASLLRSNGCLGLISTNSISEGGTRKTSLDRMVTSGTIYSASPNSLWPGSANVAISIVYYFNGIWRGSVKLKDNIVREISSSLSVGETHTVYKLKSNKGIAFQGVTTLAQGFVISEFQAKQLIAQEDPEMNVIRPLMIGDDIASFYDQVPKDYVINFWDWSEGQAKKYLAAYKLIEREVKPLRLQQSKKSSYSRIMEAWWLFWRPRPKLFQKIGGGCFGKNGADIPLVNEVIVSSRGGAKYCAFSMLSSSIVFGDSVCVIASDDRYTFCILSSDIHQVWAWERGGKLKQDLRYSHSDAFETFPFPVIANEKELARLNELGEKLIILRKEWMLENRKGLTKFYNDFHDSSKTNSQIKALRELQIEINNEVLAAYDFENFNPDFGFHEVGYLPEGKSVRFTISEVAREETLYRLAILNKARHEEGSGEALAVAPASQTQAEQVFDKVAEESETYDMFRG